MKESESPSFDELLQRMQLVFFEFMWPPFRWIRSLWVKESNGHYQLFVQTTATQDKKKLEGFNYLVGELLKGGEKMLDEREPGSKHRLEHTIQYGPTVPRDAGYRELMTDAVFSELAKKHAPWRLEEGQ